LRRSQRPTPRGGIFPVPLAQVTGTSRETVWHLGRPGNGWQFGTPGIT
jgi:hypothetical protein